MSLNSVSRESVDVVVIGGGLSGLRAALKIQAAGLSCAVVEAIDRVGGKTLTLPSKKSGPGANDLGAAWINDTNVRCTNSSSTMVSRQRFKWTEEMMSGSTMMG
jgi:monoamine oxidase